jgi:uncharacterized protein DUF2735
MDQHGPLHTAKIYSFPTRAREHKQGCVAPFQSVEFASSECGAGWYHEAAVEHETDVEAEPDNHNVIHYRRH